MIDMKQSSVAKRGNPAPSNPERIHGYSGDSIIIGSLDKQAEHMGEMTKYVSSAMLMYQV